jgi:hypothetical protein
MPTTLYIDDRALATGATEGIRHLETADWSKSVRPVAEFRALVALRLVLVGYLVGKVERTQQSDGSWLVAVTIDQNSSAGDARWQVAKSLIAPLAVYTELAGLRVVARASDTGIVPVPLLILGGVVAVSIVAAQAYVATVVVEKAAEIVDGAFKRSDAANEVQRADAEVLKLVNNHVLREQAAGQTLQLDQATAIAIDGLQQRTSKTLGAAYAGNSKSNEFPPWIIPTAGLAAAAALTAFVVVKGKKAKEKYHE